MRSDVGLPTARSRKHLCGKQTCAGCLVCADPGPRGTCGPCSRNVTSTRQNAEVQHGFVSQTSNACKCGLMLWDCPVSSANADAPRSAASDVPAAGD